MKRILLTVLAAVLFALGVLLAAPAFVDWNAYREDVAAVISEATGRDVAIAGDLDLSLLPAPRLAARRISVAGIAGGAEPVMLRIGELRMRLAVSALLRGRISVSSLTLADPVLILERTADGRGNWEIAAAAGGPGAAPGGPSPAISFDAVSLSNGILAWRAPGAETRQLDGIDATLSIAGPSGPYRLQGEAMFRDAPLHVQATLGEPGADTKAPLSATVDIVGGGRLVLSGGADRKAKSAAGTIRFTAPDAAALALALTGGSSPGMPAWDVAMESGFTIDGSAVNLRDIAARYGEMHGTGRAGLVFGEVPALTATFEFGTMDLDALLAESGRAKPNGRGGPESAAGAGPSGLPAGLEADLALSVRTARWRGGLVRNIEASVRLDSGALQIERIAAKLPGGTDVTLSGVAKPTGPGLRLDGDLAVVSDNLRAALAWAGMADSALPADRLRGFSYTSRIAVVSDAVHLAEIAARLDATRMSGAATIARRDRPSFGLRLKMDSLGLDAYLPRPAEGKATGARGRGGSIPAAAGFDANLNLSVARMTWRGKAVSDLTLDARLFDGNVVLRGLSVGDLGGARLSASGKLEDLPGKPRGDLEISLEAGDTERFAAFAEIETGALARRAGRFRLQGRAAGDTGRATVSGTLDIAGGRIAAEGTLTGLDSAPAWDLAAGMTHPDGDRLLSLFLPDRRRGGIGAVSAEFGLAGNEGTLAIRDLNARLGDMAVAGRVDVALAGPRPQAVAALSTGVLDLDRLLPAAPETAAAPRRRGSARWSRETIDLSALRTLDLDLTLWSDAMLRREVRVDNADLRARLTGGVLTVDRLTGSLFGGNFDAKGQIDAAAQPPELDATFSGRDLAARPVLGALADFDRFEGPVSLELSLAAAGRSVFELLSSLSGSGTVSGTLQARLTKEERTRAGVAGIVGIILGDKVREAGAAGDAMGTLLAAFADSPAALSGDVQIERGIARTENLLLDGRGARALTVGAADLPDWRIDSTTTLRRGEDGDEPYMVAMLKGPIDEPDVRISGAVLRAGKDRAPPPEAAPVMPVEPVSPDRKTAPPKPEKLFLDILKSLKR